jgi:hypothetical protein
MTVTNLGCTCRATISESNEADLVIPHAARFLVGSAHGRLLQGHLCHWLHGAMRLKAGFVTRKWRIFASVENQFANALPWQNFGNSKLFHIFLAISCDQDMIYPRLGEANFTAHIFLAVHDRPLCKE